jgi:heat shock protein HtpX
VTATVEHSPPRTALLVAAAVFPIVAVGVVVTAVLLVLFGPWGLLALLATAVVVAVQAWRLTHGVRERVLAGLGARPAEGDAYARLENLAEGVSAVSGAPVPDLYVVEDPGANLLLVGEDPEDPALVVTTGLLDAVDRIQLEGLVARAFAELRQGDLPAASVAVGAVARPALTLHRGGLRAVLVRPFTGLLAAGYGYVTGPDRDVLLDRAGASLTRYPPGLASALVRLDEVGTTVGRVDPATGHLWLADPGAPGPALASRPPLELRIEALRLL